jgi:hypothetical protein
VPPVGTVADLTLNTLDSANGALATTVWSAWSGVAWAPWWGQYGSMIAGGGGHADGDTNTLFRIDVASRTITKLNNPAPVYYKLDRYCADPITGWLWANSIEGDTTVQVGQPFTAHFYAHLIALPPDAVPGRTDAPRGWLYTPGRVTMPTVALRGTNAAHMLRLGETTVWEMNGTPGANNAEYGGAAYDSLRRRVWFCRVGPTNTLHFRDIAAGVQGQQMVTGVSLRGYYTTIEYWAVQDLILFCGYTGALGELQVFDPVTNVAYRPAVTGAPPPSTNNFAWTFSDAWGCWVHYPGDGSNTFYFLKPTGNPRTDPWTFSSQTVAGVVRGVVASPAYTRIRHVPALGNVLIWAARTDAPVQLIHVVAP